MQTSLILKTRAHFYPPLTLRKGIVDSGFMSIAVTPRCFLDLLRKSALTGSVLLLLLSGGCKTIGPSTIPRDRFDYSSAMGDSWKDQTLLNLVKLRYMDLPIFLDVGQIVSGYSLETSVNVSGMLSSPGTVQGDSIGVGGQGRYTDRPTITYVPLTGDNFLDGFLKPIQPASLFYLIQTGYDAEFLIKLTVDSFNGLRNRSTRIGSNRIPNEDFYRVAQLISEIQDVSGISMRIEEDEQKQQTTVIFFRYQNVAPELAAKIKEVRQLLGLPDDTFKYNLVYSAIKGGPGELALGTRSMLQVLSGLAHGVDIPEEHLQRNLVPPTPERSGLDKRLLRVRSGDKPPEDTFIAVEYEDSWFWIDNSDWQSKQTIVAIMFLFTLADTGEAESLPMITIPAQ